MATLGGNYTTRNPPNGAVFTYHVRETLPEGTDLVLTIRNTQGNQVRQMALNKTAGLKRIEWNLQGDPPQQPAARPSRAAVPRAVPRLSRAAVPRVLPQLSRVEVAQAAAASPADEGAAAAVRGRIRDAIRPSLA